ncbi:SDR family oxidoreductase [Phenylobacterium sp.]|uniref:SDR family NAD(P)-dependent oxidoreductase n=1 Tax=Phenylobacterium sp. TaxID=1871053 RepID=UPI00272F0786|nr:SDR family oxidoreductase [Phenylobacterium sp.]MDP1615959.1 SDR family oxidoreductase [Phenylobacterium sp.]MDP1986540.1 SDR family oxidoreductase [Phenylobacterium sp.]
MDRRLALVTGASAGIGAAFARALAAQGCDLALTARRADRLEALAAELRDRHGVEVLTLAADLADPATPAALDATLAAQGRSVDILVNNAGYGLPGGFGDNPWPDQAAVLQVMLTAPCELAHRLLPGMRARGFGRIINVASVAGLTPGGVGLYGPVKAFLIGFSQSLHQECASSGVHVSALCPGLTWSEFHDVNGMREPLDRTTPGWLWMDAETVVAAGLAAVEANRPVCVPGAVNKALAGLAWLLPDRWVMAITAAQGWRSAKP